MNFYIKKDAYIDKTGKYRYCLFRQWGKNKNNCVNFVMLNPSIADDKIDDRTLQSCVRISKFNKFDALYITNLFAYRSKKPEKLLNVKEPIGKENNKYLKKYSKKCKKVIFAWGNRGHLYERDEKIVKMISKITKPYCLGKTNQQHPKHPLYVKEKTKFKLF